MFWKASSTLLASRADVSMKERLFSPESELASQRQRQLTSSRCPKLTGKLLGFFGWHSAQVSQIALISHKHDDNVRICVISELFQPPVNIIVGLMLADVVNKKGTDGTTIVGRGNGAVTLLTSSVPDLRLDRLRIDLNRTGCELHANGRLGVQVEFIAGETTQKVGLSNTRVSNKHHCIIITAS